MTKSFEENELVLGVFIDLKKAFDTVNHEILLDKLKLYGINSTCIGYDRSKLIFQTEINVPSINVASLN